MVNKESVPSSSVDWNVAAPHHLRVWSLDQYHRITDLLGPKRHTNKEYISSEDNTDKADIQSIWYISGQFSNPHTMELIQRSLQSEEARRGDRWKNSHLPYQHPHTMWLPRDQLDSRKAEVLFNVTTHIKAKFYVRATLETCIADLTGQISGPQEVFYMLLQDSGIHNYNKNCYCQTKPTQAITTARR